jgi:hypothetical protein
MSLTALRITAPAALVTANWAALTGPRDALAALAVGGAAVAVVAAFSPLTGDTFVNGSSYGDERRMPLRVPGPVLFGPLPLAWVAAVAPLVTGPLLLAARAWLAGAVVVAVGLPAVYASVRAMHGLARRWVVFVPAGLVLHDLHALNEAVPFPRRSVGRVGPAPADGAGGVFDATQGSFGLAIEVELREPATISPRRADRRVETIDVRGLLCTPTRPGAVLREAAARRLPVA